MSQRSFLFVPGNRPARFDKACAAGADAVVIDLEDAVVGAEKAAARDAVRAWLQAGGRAWLRVNGSGTDWHAADLPLLDLPGVLGVLLPKAERVEDLQVALDDPQALADDVARARRLGMGAKLCIHPQQVAEVNRGFLPRPDEIAWARQVVDAALAAHDNAVRLDGKLIDRPIIERARALLAAAQEAAA